MVAEVQITCSLITSARGFPELMHIQSKHAFGEFNVCETFVFLHTGGCRSHQ